MSDKAYVVWTDGSEHHPAVAKSAIAAGERFSQKRALPRGQRVHVLNVEKRIERTYVVGRHPRSLRPAGRAS